MKFTLLEDTGPKAYWLVEGAKPALLNALRRAVIAELDAFAIDTVEFMENSSPLFNDYLANRIGLVPLTFDESASKDAQIIFSLEAEALEEPRAVYSGELKSQDDLIAVHSTNIPIIKLGKGQVLRLQGTAIMNKGRKHAKFQSAIASYGHLGDYKLAEKCAKCGGEIKARLSKDLAAKIKSKPVESALCFKCEDAAFNKDPSKHPDSKEYIFFVESYNNIPAVRQLQRAIDALENGLEAFNESKS
ncbi:DNA-directed RNA polymerase subunit D [Candidatus Micrarchaeota archaeon CG_4_10_14_0_2_um_filter_60_11]|nr:MAG: hypothetical protein AUJ16_04145 [Candidatus Micrarchaeota archaeon CG1_02_60_51]PIN95861.1 MAG: DNA-directed RNA polymerase subunit D [Candidatus Micrarchaeota archaeon CG10_big_fil_rev_8_21_14_0_10_60_32]PIO02306.1 MAG: DNA-directed RNA polymerase subunit D [Candidatus Micrarchaeota archaeon CG09_land_8_20_14_0_10_60_16]PIY91289.1 MAG: DNA-directed RNA polymerase subunit D [Candidatus Micrarchaeota archaeon CG_4_10_14_0_8_um_filter_60_7]PIZ91258.1 MAG: DNA-directed RNA polymerase subu